MKKLNIKILAFLLMFSTIVIAQQTPAPKQTKDIAIVGATAHIGNGEIIEQSLIVIKNGKLVTVVDSAVAKMDLTNMEVIDASGKHVYPGFIGANTSFGLVEIEAVRATDDQDEVGNKIPHIRSLIAYNTESKVVESMRPNGILIAQVSPNGGRISGTSSIVQLDAWNWEDAAVKVDDGIHINWPNNFARGRRRLGEDPGLKINKDYTKQVKDLEDYFNESKAYNKGDKTTRNLEYEALSGLFKGEKRMYIRVNNEKGIIDAINFSKNNNVKNMVIVGGYNAYKVTDLLKKNNVSVLIDRSHRLPVMEDDDYDFPYKNPKLLMDAGVIVGIHTGNTSNFQTRNLPFYAGTTVAHGLTKEQALQLITSNTAKILGIDDMYGTLESGKSATLFISEGDALDMRTNKITHAFIDGRKISLETHQTKLWKRYYEKYKNQ